MTAHVRRNVVVYVALFATLGGTSYAAAGLTPGNIRTGPPTSSASDPGAPSDGPGGPSDGQAGPSDGQAGPSDPGGAAGPGSIGARARGTSSVVAKHGGWTDIPLTGNTWTQPAAELELVAGTVKISIPHSCTGGFGNSLLLSVDGNATTFAAVPAPPASGTLTLPFLIGTLGEPGKDTDHKLTAKFNDACTKAGEDYKIADVKIDVLKFL